MVCQKWFNLWYVGSFVEMLNTLHLGTGIMLCVSRGIWCWEYEIDDTEMEM